MLIKSLSGGIARNKDQFGFIHSVCHTTVAAMVHLLSKKYPGRRQIYCYHLLHCSGTSVRININLSFVSWMLYLKGSKLIYASIKTNDSEKFNEGYKICYKSVVLTVVSVVTGIIYFLIKLFFINQV